MDVERLYRRYGPMVIRRCRHLLGDDEEARDAAQDVFVKLLMEQGRLREDAPSSLLYRMATNLCLNRIRDPRRRRTVPGSPLLEEIAEWDGTDGRVEAGNLLARLFGRQRESTRVMACLHYVDGLTLEEVAREVGLSVSGVRRRLRVLRASLRELEDEES